MKKTLLLALTVVSSVHAADIPMPADIIAKVRSQPGVASIGCNEFKISEYAEYNGQPLAPIKDLLHGRRLLSDAKIECSLDKSYKGDGKYELTVKEYGTLNGKPIHFYHTDGSTSIGGEIGEPSSWSIGCKVDAMNDSKSCNMSNGDLFIFRDKSGWSVFISGDHYPGTDSLIRINGGKPITTRDNDGMFSHTASARIVGQLKSGTEVATRYTNWPYNTYTDGIVNTESVETALAYLDLIYKSF
ncbi:hypothetical protein IOC47_22920 [Enterobacter cloacae]|uniref:hypothetical protein n=1 Tax=Enterobacteriaceae TaxID=543 RepID=UPI000598AEFC|nr:MULTISPECIES: hypothetical protein [Enterobacteriaceae]HBM7601053.1 hypothetical protein [Enterobacter asburiae]HBR1984265.1 hypothetical protein [Klebsiella quasipneumoniae subsp. quasipneumoniae]HCI6708504.1 hypothetical protein [Klebsiella quasipneumoniae subsp. similipneumoniae]ELS4527934.1 hypothetical protein [Enterobacter hormaechei]KII59400.1 hypothetical protein SE21_04520 [Klebsiella quasipneumoniae]